MIWSNSYYDLYPIRFPVKNSSSIINQPKAPIYSSIDFDNLFNLVIDYHYYQFLITKEIQNGLENPQWDCRFLFR